MTHSLSRRTILRGLGTAVALPFLEAMTGANVLAATPAKSAPPKRTAYIYVPNGIHMPDWTPQETGALQLRPSMEPIKDFKSYLTVLSGLTLNGARSLGDGPGDHARSVAAFLTGAHPKKTDGANIFNGVSVDQATAERVGEQTRFASLELGIEPSASAGNCDSGYSCAYSSNVSWRTPTTPVSKEVNPRTVFDRLFGLGEDDDQRKARFARDQKRKSVLDFVSEDANRLRKRLGAGDQRKVDEYLHSVREIEQRLAGTEKLTKKELEVPDYPRPAGVPKDFAEHLKLMFDMFVLALQTDSTRIVTFMYANDSSNRGYPQIGVREGHHDLSHHGRDEEKQKKIARINVFHMEQFAYLLGKLRDVKEGGGNLLDNLMLVYGSGIADGDSHAHHDLPILLVGKGGGAIKPDRHLRYKKDTPLCNLYLTMMDRMGARAEKFGDSYGMIEDLA